MPTSPIHVVVLAAGRGSRLGVLGPETPKWLLEVAGETIADRQLSAISQAKADVPGSVGSVSVVTGHAADAIAGFLETRGQPQARLIHNPEFATLNNWYTVLLALETIDPGPEAPVVVLNSDLLAEPGWTAAFLVESATTALESLIAVDTERELTDESMKVAVNTSDGDGPAPLLAIGKQGVSDPVGEYVGMLMFRGSVLRDFRVALEEFEGRAEYANEWYESAVGRSARSGTRWNLWSTPDSRWVEIDDDSDYERAIDLIGVRG